PGLSFPLYFAGAKLATYFPVSIPGHGLALNMTVQSYNGSLEFGLTACRRAVPDVADLGDYVLAEHKKLLSLILAGAGAEAPAPVEKAAPVAVAHAAAKPKPAGKKVVAKAARAKAMARKPTTKPAGKRTAALN
ncbi:MAG: WS/DGAT domain-containing protein, partial [Variovorax sp.]